MRLSGRKLADKKWLVQSASDGLRGRFFNIRDVYMDFQLRFKVYNLVSIRPKSMKLGQITNLNVIFLMVGSVYRLVTTRNSPQVPVFVCYNIHVQN